MAAEFLDDAELVVNSVNVSSWCTDITLEQSSDAVEDTAFGDAARSRVGGLVDGSLSFTFHLDFASSATYATFNAAFNTVVACTVKKDGTDAIAATNPEQQFSVLVNDNKLLDASIGSLHSTSVTWPLVTDVTHDTTP